MMAEPLRLEYLDPAELTANPANWRRHPKAQVDALKGALAQVGWAGALLFNERTGRLIDGHARREVTPPGEKVPVLVGSWSEADEAVILATLDPLAAMALADAPALDALLKSLTVNDQALSEMLARLAEDEGIIPPDFQTVGIETQGRLDQKSPVVCPECGHSWTL
jgi:hypothetical protein